jgi:hypothetical protein
LGEGSQSRRIWRGEGKSYIKSATPNHFNHSSGIIQDRSLPEITDFSGKFSPSAMQDKAPHDSPWDDYLDNPRSVRNLWLASNLSQNATPSLFYRSYQKQ